MASTVRIALHFVRCRACPLAGMDGGPMQFPNRSRDHAMRARRRRSNTRVPLTGTSTQRAIGAGRGGRSEQLSQEGFSSGITETPRPVSEEEISVLKPVLFGGSDPKSPARLRETVVDVMHRSKAREHHGMCNDLEKKLSQSTHGAVDRLGTFAQIADTGLGVMNAIWTRFLIGEIERLRHALDHSARRICPSCLGGISNSQPRYGFWKGRGRVVASLRHRRAFVVEPWRRWT